MKKSLKTAVTVCVVLGMLLSAAASALAEIKMGVFPRRNLAQTRLAFTPLAEKLSKELGEPVVLVTPKTFKQFWDSVERKEFDLVHFNQYHYLKSHKDLGYEVIAANEEFGSKTIAGALTIRSDSGIEKVGDLKGKKIIFGGGKKAMGSYIAPTAILKKHGLIEGKDYTAEFSNSPPSAVIGAYNKAFDAAGSGNVVIKLKVVTDKIDASQLKILAESEPFAQLPWAVKAELDKGKAEKIQQIMTTLQDSADGREVLKAAKVDSFFKVSDSDYDKAREIVQYALGESL